MTVRFNGSDRANGDAEAAFNARVEFKRLIIGGSFPVEKQGVQNDEAAESGMDQQAVMTQFSQATGNCNRFMLKFQDFLAAKNCLSC